MMARHFEVPEFNWAGSRKKVELSSEKIIRELFELASVMEGDFMEALRFVLTSSTRRCIDEMKVLKQNLATPSSSGSSQNRSVSASVRPTNFAMEESLPTQPLTGPLPPSTTSRSGADLI